MQAGRIVLIAFVTSALTSAAAFFALRGLPRRGEAPVGASGVNLPTPSPRPVAIEQLQADDGAASAGEAEPAEQPRTEGATATSTSSAPPRPAGRSDEAVVPLVIRKRLPAARRVLQSAGFGVRLSYSYDEDVSEGRILRQFPPAGSKAPRGSSVKLVVNQDY